MLRKIIAIAGIFAVAGILVGCGGGGGGSALGSIATFFTDSMDGNDHVWVKVYKVELVKNSGPVEVFLSADGKEIDLKTLRDSSGARFAFMSDKPIPHDSYTGVRVTMDKSLVEFPAGATSGLSKNFADAFDDGSGKTVATFNFPSPKQFSSGDNLIIDFDLANWDDGPSGISPVVKEGDPTGLDDAQRHEDQEYEGQVQNLHGEAPDLSFNLSSDGGSYSVTLSADTAILNADGSPSPSLANGKSVEVRGVWDAVNHTLNASRVTIKSAEHADEPNGIEGPSSEVNTGAGTFVLQVQEAHGFMPGSASMTVHVAEGTQYFSDGGSVITKDQFFSALVNGRKAEAWGSASGSDFNADRVKLERLSDGGGGGPAIVEFGGTLHEKNLANNTLNISPTSWEGITWSLGQNLGMLVNGDTQFKDAAGESMTKEAFYGAILVGNGIEVHGYFSNGVFYCTEAKMRL